MEQEPLEKRLSADMDAGGSSYSLNGGEYPQVDTATPSGSASAACGVDHRVSGQDVREESSSGLSSVAASKTRLRSDNNAAVELGNGLDGPQVESGIEEVLDEAALQAQRDREEGLHGCSHYKRRCRMVSPCCGEVFWCRHCHNDAKSVNERTVGKRHELDRTAVRELICALCDTRQPAATHCSTCGVSFGAYSCLKCCFFDDDSTKQQFHCEACGICRVGGQHNFFHCDTCGCCYSVSLRDNHVCVENSMRQNCPVCFEYLFDSVRPTAVLPCGHTIHSDCLQDMERNRQLSCPICMKSYTNLAPLWRRIDEEVANTPMPPEYANWQVEILCNDCNQSGRVAFHILGLKCPHCSSYNTRRIAVARAGAEDVGPPPLPPTS